MNEVSLAIKGLILDLLKSMVELPLSSGSGPNSRSVCFVEKGVSLFTALLLRSWKWRGKHHTLALRI